MLAVVQRPPRRAVLGVLGGLFLLALETTSAEALLVNLAAGQAPAGWPAGAVPVNDPDPSGAPPILPADLYHLSYFNWSVYQNPSWAGTWHDEFWIDGVQTELVTRTGIDALGRYWVQRNTGPIFMQGGRHTLEVRTDPGHTSGEDYGQWGDNVYRIPFLWTPTPITPLTSTETIPPQGNFNAPSPNCNSYSYTATIGTAWVASMAAKSPGSQPAFLIYDDYMNSTTGLQHEIARSTPSGIETNFVVGSPSAPSTIYPSCARLPGTPNVFVSVAVADAAGRRAESGNASWPSINMPKLTAAQVFEANLTQGVGQTMTVTRFLGQDDLELRVFGPGTTVASQSQAQWISHPRGGDDEYDDLVFTPPATGTYLIVVARVDASYLDTAMGYALTLATTSAVSVPSNFAMSPLAAAPSPASGPVRLSFTLAQPTHVLLALYDVQGRAVRTLVDETLPAGPYARTWDGTNDDGRAMAPGRYFARLVAGSRRENLSIVRIR